MVPLCSIARGKRPDLARAEHYHSLEHLWGSSVSLDEKIFSSEDLSSRQAGRSGLWNKSHDHLSSGSCQVEVVLGLADAAFQQQSRRRNFLMIATILSSDQSIIALSIYRVLGHI